MKKLITLLLVLTGMVSTASAQRETTETIRVAFTDPTGDWAQDHFYIYVFGTSTSKDDTWPGVDVSANTLTIDGATYYYRDFPIATYGTGFKVIAVNNDGTLDSNQSQSEDLTWCYDRATITGDTYYSLKHEWDGSNHRKAELKEMYYIADYNNSGKIMRATQSGTNYSATFKTSDYPQFVIANSFAFKDDGTLDFTQNNNYPANIYRPNYQNILAFANITNYVGDSERNEFYRWHSSGYFDASALSGVDLSMTFSISSYNPTSYTISPYFERTITNGCATFSSDYNVTIPDGVTAYYATACAPGTVTMTAISDGIPSTEGVYLVASNGSYKFEPAVSVESTVMPNKMVKGTDDGVAASTGSAYNYVLASQGGTVGFFEVNSAVTADMTGKAYLQNNSSIKPAGARVAIIFNDETGILGVEESKNIDNRYYNLSGQCVAQPTKGMYIVNGKKIMVNK